MATIKNANNTAKSRYAENVYFQDGIVLTGGLVVLVYLVLATSLDAAGYVENMSQLFPVALGALTLGFLMSFSRFDGFFALSHSMFTGLAWILFVMSGMVTGPDIAPFVTNGIPETQAKAYFVLLRWLNWVDAAINDVPSNDNYVFVFEMCFLVWWLTYLGVWSIFRYGYTWRAIIPAGIVLLINTYYAPQSILGFLIFFCLLALLLLVRTNLAEQQLRWREQRVYFSQDISLDFLRNGFMYSVMVIALAWLAPGLGRNVQVRTVLAPINDQWQETTERWNRLYQGINRQTRPASAAFGRTLSLGGARNVGNSFVFQVDSARGRYWRAVVYDTYTGRQWVNTGGEDVVLDANESVDAAGWALREPYTQTITLLAPTGNVLFSAPDIIRASVPMEVMVRPVPAPALSGADDAVGVEVTMAQSRQLLEKDDVYSVVSNQTAITERALREAPEAYPESILEQYLQLPENFSARVASEAEQRTAGLSTAYEKAKAIETYLRTFAYNDNINAPAPDQDPVEYFLYDIQEGYCDYYATSMAVMLRSIGIPARVVSGYAEGTYDSEAFLFYVSERDAHTWVEVYFPGYGWIEFEPTAGETALDRPSGDDPIFQDFLDEELASGPVFPNAEEEMFDPEGEFPPQDAFADESASGASGLLNRDTWWLWVIATPLLLIVGGWFIWRTQVSGPTEFDPELPPILYDRLQRWAERLGLQLPISHTPYERAAQLGHVVPDGRTSIDSITEGYVRYRFARGVQPAADRLGAPDGHQLFGSWRELRPIFWKKWFNKLFVERWRSDRNPFTLVKK